MAQNAVARRYAVALSELAHERGVLDEVEAELRQLQEVAVDGTGLARLLANERISLPDKERIVNEVLRDSISDLTKNFLLLLVQKGRIADLDEMIEAYIEMANEYRGMLDVWVTSAFPLDEDQLRALAGSLQQKTGKRIRMQQTTDASLVGGVVLRVGDRVIDGSVAGILRRMRRTLASADAGQV